MKTFTLNNGVEIPSIGYGTWRVPESELCESSVLYALQNGYRHIDTAACYKNEKSIGKAIAKSGLKREEIFITSKLWNTEHTYEKTINAFNQSAKDLGVDYIDLYLIHWPVPVDYKDCWQTANAETWRAFEDLYKAGRIKAIGLSNFKPHHIEELLKTAVVKPMVNQIEMHPGMMRKDVTEYCRDKAIQVEAWAPFAVGEVFKLDLIKELAKKYNRSLSQIVLRWFLQNGILPLPKSVTPSRITENIGVFDFEIEEEDMLKINALKGDDPQFVLRHDSDNIDF